MGQQIVAYLFVSELGDNRAHVRIISEAYPAYTIEIALLQRITKSKVHKTGNLRTDLKKGN